MSPSGNTRLEPQSAATVLMVRPACFGFNPQTAPSNAFQHAAAALAQDETQRVALQEFDALAAALQHSGVQVVSAADSLAPPKPDAIFPNNWVSFHGDGSVVLYPMLALNRRLERREEILQQVVRDGGFRVTRSIDLTYREAEAKYLEGTGSLVLDRSHRVAYACVSPRTDLDVLGEFAQRLDYDLMSFEAHDGTGLPVYHTNVLMAIGAHFAVVCGEAIVRDLHRDAVFSRLEATGHDIVDISLAQMAQFAGNVLELAPPQGSVVAMSSRALDSFTIPQRRALEAHADIVAVAIPTIEHLGGGGVRCMLAEVHLPRAVEPRDVKPRAVGPGVS
jgi:hypothetical protein